MNNLPDFPSFGLSVYFYPNATGLKRLFSKPLYPILLVIFFFEHALLEIYDPSLKSTALKLIFIYALIAMILAGLCWLIYKDWRKAALPAFSIMAFNFFYGSFSDWIKKIFHNSFITKLSFILGVTMILLVLLFIYLKRTNRKLIRLTQYLNLLFSLLIIIDGIYLVPKLFFDGNRHELKKFRMSSNLGTCDSCKRPDIYFIVTDEYAGKNELKDLFAFDNSSFEQQLTQRGFHVVNNSISNYNATVYSISSVLNMEYIQGKYLKNPMKVNHRDMLACRDRINHNNVLTYLRGYDYEVYNHSFFELDGKKKAVKNLFYYSNAQLLTGQTFLQRFIRNAGARFASKKKLEAIKKNELLNDITIDSLCRQTVLLKSDQPKFVYAHFNRPHHPYYFDSAGMARPLEQLNDVLSMDKKAYIQYLLYANKKLLDLVDFIRSHSKEPPVIILMSDHGFRQLDPSVDKKYLFMNLNAVYLPDSNYNGFYNGMSAVNEFRVVINTIFHQQLVMVKDSTHFLTE